MSEKKGCWKEAEEAAAKLQDFARRLKEVAVKLDKVNKITKLTTNSMEKMNEKLKEINGEPDLSPSSDADLKNLN